MVRVFIKNQRDVWGLFFIYFLAYRKSLDPGENGGYICTKAGNFGFTLFPHVPRSYDCCFEVRLRMCPCRKHGETEKLCRMCGHVLCYRFEKSSYYRCYGIRRGMRNILPVPIGRCVSAKHVAPCTANCMIEHVSAVCLDAFFLDNFLRPTQDPSELGLTFGTARHAATLPMEKGAALMEGVDLVEPTASMRRTRHAEFKTSQPAIWEISRFLVFLLTQGMAPSNMSIYGACLSSCMQEM